MNALKAVAGGLVVAAGVLFGAEAAQAGPQKFKSGFGQSSKFSGGFGNGSKFHGGFGNGPKFPHQHGGGFGHGGPFGHSGPFVPDHGGHWHDTSHYDYHPGEYVWNGFRWVYVPGHFDFHRTGHLHHPHHH